MNTLDILNNVLSAFNKPILKDTDKKEEIKKKPIVYTVDIDYSLLKKDKDIEEYKSPKIEIKETSKSRSKKIPNKNIKSKKQTKSNKNK